MQRILVIGAGQIGSLISFLFASSGKYQVYLADLDPKNGNMARLPQLPSLEMVKLDASQAKELDAFLNKTPVDAVVSSLPYYANLPVAQAAKRFKLHYFDLTEDVATTEAIRELSQGSPKAYVPQCGLAPGFISIVANHLLSHFPDEVEAVKLRVGALPTNISNALNYAFTWSIEGLINEYGNPCQALSNGKEVFLPPLDDVEELVIDGLAYEAFNTSGGVGSLASSCRNKVKHLTYKTIRYPGHCAKFRFLMNDLQLNEDRETLKHILQKSLPRIEQDVVLVYVSVCGKQNGQLKEEHYVRKFYPKTVGNLTWTAIQMTTASSLCAILDLVLAKADQFSGFVRQEQFDLPELTSNAFGAYYA